MLRIEQLLREKIGLDVKSVGPTLVERAVRLRIKRLGLKSNDDYAAYFRKTPGELAELIEGVVVTETWFFREEESFKMLVKHLYEEWIPRNLGKQIRILSIPCSTGEEPYSIAISLLEAGLLPQSFHLDAVDISANALELARLAVYGKNSFRSKEFQPDDRYFTTTPHGNVLKETVRDHVKFKQGNLLDPEFVRLCGTYSFIFCRNLLIYFDDDAQAHAFGHLKQLLAPNGLLFVGPAEMPLAVSHGFVSTNAPLAFSCRKAEPAHTAPEKFPMAYPMKKAAPVSALPDLAAKDRFSAPPSLETARQLADAGRWAEAAEFCSAYLQFNESSAAAFHLLGRAHEVAGDLADAEACYRKALYLEPNHRETLLQMVTLSEKKGDLVQVKAFQRRIKRVEAKTAKA